VIIGVKILVVNVAQVVENTEWQQLAINRDHKPRLTAQKIFKEV